jgi:hypothetical protein
MTIEVAGHRKVAFEAARSAMDAEPLVVAGVLGERHERKLDRRHVDRAYRCSRRLPIAGDARPERHDGERKLRPVGTDQPCGGRVRKAGEQSAGRPCVGERERVREHRAGVPVEVPEPAPAYRHPVRHGIPVTTMVVASPIAGGATSWSA